MRLAVLFAITLARAAPAAAETLGPGTFAWLEANARRFGFKRTVTGEPWHWEYVKPPRKQRRHRQRAADRV